ILVLHEGAIIRDAVPQEIWRDPQSAFVAKLLGIGNIIEGEVIAENKVKTAYGVFSLDCEKQVGEKIQLLVTVEDGRGEEIQLTVEDVLFYQDQFQVKAGGGLTVQMKDAPLIGDVITVQVQVKCLS
ncbi:MAG: hypothetical protein EDM79_10575, partial [Chloroflexi bacterium]